MVQRLRLLGLATAAALALAGCGSTVQLRGSATVGQGGLSLSGEPQQATAIGTAGTNDPQRLATATPGGPTPAGPVSGTRVTGAGGTFDRQTTGAVGTTAGGTTGLPAGKPLTVGVITSGNAGAYFSSLGVNGNFGDQRLQAKAVVDYLNKRGGVLGHPIKLTFYDYDASSTTSQNAANACTAFTQDAHAFASVGVAGMDDGFHSCAFKHGMLVLSDGDIKSRRFFQNYPTTIELSDMDVDRKYYGMVLGLKEEGFFTPGAKVGILLTEDPNDVEGVEKGMKPALASLGITDTLDIKVPTDPSGNASGIASAVLKFRSAGVTHILFGRASAYTFAQGAQSQSYFPKMGIESRQSPALLMQGSNSQQQLDNTYGIGYQPVQDVDAAHDPGPLSSNQTLCKKVLDDAGQGWGTSRLAMASSLYLCEGLLFLHDTFVGAPSVSTAAFLENVAQLGTSFKSTLTFTTRFSAKQHDGALDYRPLRYQDACSCFVYTGPSRPLPTPNG